MECFWVFWNFNVSKFPNFLTKYTFILWSWEGRRWIVVDIYQDAKLRGTYISSTVNWPWGDICFSIYQISCRKIKKWKQDLFVPQQHHLVGTLFTNIIYKHFGDFYHWQVKVHHFLGICLYKCFIYRSNFFFLKMSQNDMPSRLRC